MVVAAGIGCSVCWDFPHLHAIMACRMMRQLLNWLFTSFFMCTLRQDGGVWLLLDVESTHVTLQLK
jgi:hypothetical protein